MPHNCKFKSYTQFIRYLTARPVLRIWEKWVMLGQTGADQKETGKKGGGYVNSHLDTSVTLTVFTQHNVVADYCQLR